MGEVICFVASWLFRAAWAFALALSIELALWHSPWRPWFFGGDR